MSNGLVRMPDGSIRFKHSALTPRLRRYAEQKRLEGERQHAEHERLHAEHMRLLRETVPVREVVHVVRDDSEEKLWRAWRAYPA